MGNEESTPNKEPEIMEIKEPKRQPKPPKDSNYPKKVINIENFGLILEI